MKKFFAGLTVAVLCLCVALCAGCSPKKTEEETPAPVAPVDVSGKVFVFETIYAEFGDDVPSNVKEAVTKELNETRYSDTILAYKGNLKYYFYANSEWEQIFYNMYTEETSILSNGTYTQSGATVTGVAVNDKTDGNSGNETHDIEVKGDILRLVHLIEGDGSQYGDPYPAYTQVQEFKYLEDL